MSLKLKLKPNPTRDALLQIRPHIRVKEFLIKNNNNYNEFDKIQRQKILDYVERQGRAKRAQEYNEYRLRVKFRLIPIIERQYGYTKFSLDYQHTHQ
jgi:hypothetical protein